MREREIKICNAVGICNSSEQNRQLTENWQRSSSNFAGILCTQSSVLCWLTLLLLHSSYPFELFLSHIHLILVFVLWIVCLASVFGRSTASRSNAPGSISNNDKPETFEQYFCLAREEQLKALCARCTLKSMQNAENGMFNRLVIIRNHIGWWYALFSCIPRRNMQ